MPFQLATDQPPQAVPVSKSETHVTRESPPRRRPSPQRRSSPHRRRQSVQPSTAVSAHHQPEISHSGSGDRDFFNQEFLPFRFFSVFWKVFPYLFNLVVSGVSLLLSGISSLFHSVVHLIEQGYSSLFLDMFFWPLVRVVLFVALSLSGFLPVVWVYILGLLLFLLDVFLPLREIFLLKTNRTHTKWMGSPISLLFITLVLLIILFVVLRQPPLQFEKAQPASFQTEENQTKQPLTRQALLQNYENELIDEERRFIESSFQPFFERLKAYEQNFGSGLTRAQLYALTQKIIREEGQTLQSIPREKIAQMVVESLARHQSTQFTEAAKEDIQNVLQKVLAETHFVQNLQTEMDSVRSQYQNALSSFQQGNNEQALDQLISEWVQEELQRLQREGVTSKAPLLKSVHNLPFSELEKAYILRKVEKALETQPILIKKSA